MEIFNADRQRKIEINNLLQRIKYQAGKQDVDTFIYFPIFIIDGNKVEHKESLLNQTLFSDLKSMGAIEFSQRTNAEINRTIEKANKSKNKPFIIEGYWVKPVEPKFSQLCEEYKRTIKDTTKEKITKYKPVIELHLNNVGDFWREPKERYCYKMGETSDRLKIIRYLAVNKGYCQTLQISSALKGKSEQSIRTEIAKVRNNINKFLKVNGKQILEGRKDSGYRIGLGYKIKVVE